ncbi:MAG: TIGR00299 family protein [Ilumatobacter coccineus]|uniref:TIGR00299 family protein n=1 Tax=Ilumatobacter coccineus TaxID=467094 RepID=A0A2G6K8N3_9ACTN|nr:MAG: TIGR00299 family protein [Ilumatobacter coccineus]
MTRCAHVLAPQGLSGDMWLGALIDAGASVDAVRSAVSALDLDGVDLIPAPIDGHGIAATHVEVVIPPTAPRVPDLSAATALIRSADLSETVTDLALEVYTRLAEAEAAAHATTIDRVHFHELGNPDTAVDIVGTCAGVVDLGLDSMTCGPIAVGSGTVETSHGRLAVPVPAVTELIAGFMIEGGHQARELTTPTGAALAAVLTTPVDAMPPLRLSGHGRGAASEHRDGRSIMTILIGDTDESAHHLDDSLIMVETTIDDLSPELIPDVLDRVRALPSVADSWATPAIMKKGRPGFTLSVLVTPDRRDQVVQILLDESGTLGVRWYRVDRQIVERSWITIEIEGHPISIKIGGSPHGPYRVAPEHDDVAAAARALHQPVRVVYDQAMIAAWNHLAV